MADFIHQPAFEIGRRAEIRGSNSWFVVLTPPSEAEDILLDFVAELSAVLNQSVRVVRALPSPIEKLRKELFHPENDTVVIVDLNKSNSDVWSALDINRSGLLRSGTVVLWLSLSGLTILCKFAPNLRSFIGGSIFYLSLSDGQMTPEECNARVSALESHFEISTSKMIALAEAGKLPTEPQFVEWLVLIGRGDLV